MSGRFARLSKVWSLRGWSDVPRAVVNRFNANVFELSTKAFYVAEACDGQTDFDSMAFLPEHHFILDELIEKGVAEPCHLGDSIKTWQRYRIAPNPILKEIHWCVTGRCNLNCRHCYMQSPSGRYGELPYEDIVHLIEQFEQANVLRVSLTGGEPFIRKDLLDILRMLAQKGIWVTEIYSNGMLITEQLLDDIKQMELAPNFQLSFDGYGGHDYMRGVKGVEKFVIAAIRKVRAAGFPVIIASNMDKINVACLEQTYELLLDLDVQAWRIGAPQAMGNWKGATTDLSLDEQANAYVPILDRWLRDGRPFEIVLGLFLRAPGKGTRFGALNSKAHYSPESYDCGSCRENPHLLPDGTLLPCPGYVDSALQSRVPNILAEGLSRVWTESILRTLANLKKSDLLVLNQECGSCEFFGNCGAGCRASALRETGDLMSKDPVACQLWRGRYKQRFSEMVFETQ